MGYSVDQHRARRLLSGVLCVGLLMASSARGDDGQRQTPILDIQDMTFVASEAADSRLLLRADSARFDPRSDSAELMDVEATVYGENSDVAFEMTCDRGDLDLRTNDFVASGNVLGRTDDGMEFAVDRVNYDHEKRVLFTDEDILITDDGGTYRGGGFRYFVEDKRFQLLGGASVVQGQ